MKAIRWHRALVIGAGVALLLFVPSVVRAYRVAGESDAPQFRTGDLILVHVAAYDLREPFAGRSLVTWSEPAVGDRVLFLTPDDGSVVFKRVAFVGGEQVEIPGTDFAPVTVPADHVFVLSTDLAAGRDSRHYGPVPRHLVLGRVLANLTTLGRRP